MIFAKHALVAGEWVQNLRLTLSQGRITGLTPDSQPQPGDCRVSVLLPALSNLHSHSFQRAMAGMTEYRSAGRDSFWTWRDLMYRFVRRLTPDQVQAIAAQAFLEMQEAGFAAVGEFHYLHHGPDGTPYADLAELSARICAAADETGIGLTHLPVLYTYGGAGMQALSAGQARFGNSVDDFADLVAAVRAQPGPSDRVVGIAPHSLRATCPADLARVIPLGGPIHIHVAEQPQEVAQITQWLGAPPVQWLLDHAPLGPDWCLIHATHMNDAETKGAAQTGAIAGLCPITESNLGDGPFRGPDWIAAGGRFGIGTDSNIRITMAQELQVLEYSQRLRDLSRNVMVSADQPHTGAFLYQSAALGGAAALARPSGQIALGSWADLVAIDRDHPTLCALTLDQMLDGLIFAAPDGVITDLWSAGRHSVQQGRHIARDRVTAQYRQALRSLIAAE